MLCNTVVMLVWARGAGRQVRTASGAAMEMGTEGGCEGEQHWLVLAAKRERRMMVSDKRLMSSGMEKGWKALNVCCKSVGSDARAVRREIGRMGTCPRSSAVFPANAPGVSMKVMMGQPKCSACLMYRIAFRYPLGCGMPKLRYTFSCSTTRSSLPGLSSLYALL